MCQWARRLSRVKLAANCGARSALRRWSCWNCERRCQRIHCVRKYDGRFSLHVQGKTNFISPTLQTYTRQQRRVFQTSKGGERQQSFTQAVPNELKLGDGGESGESWPSAWRWRLGVGGRKGRRNNDEAGIRAVELRPDFKTTQVYLVEKINI